MPNRLWRPPLFCLTAILMLIKYRKHYSSLSWWAFPCQELCIKRNISAKGDKNQSTCHHKKMLRKTWECEANNTLFCGGTVFSGLLIVGARLWFFLGIGSGGFSLSSFLFKHPFTLHHGRRKRRGNECLHAVRLVMQEHVGSCCSVSRGAVPNWRAMNEMELSFVTYCTSGFRQSSLEFYFHIYKIEQWAPDPRASLCRFHAAGPPHCGCASPAEETRGLTD